MIIQIRGTSGSGKTWALKQWMDLYTWKPQYIDNRKNPLYYTSWIGDYMIIVLGHYETACGGCDTIGSARQVFELINSIDEAMNPPPKYIICEGLLLSEDVKWVKENDDQIIRIVYLTTPIEKCIAQIKRRRLEAGNEKPLNESNTRNRVGVIEKSRRRLEDVSHVRIRRAPAKQIPKIMEGWVIG